MTGQEKVRIEYVKEERMNEALKNQITLETEICSAGFLWKILCQNLMKDKTKINVN